MKKIRHRSSIQANVKIPGSKSMTHRALIAAGLAKGESVLLEPLVCDDTLHTINGLRQLGATIRLDGDRIRMSGTGGDFRPVAGRKEIYLGNSGTSYRFILSTVALGKGSYVLRGTARMEKRPVGALVNALKVLGVDAMSIGREGFPPVLVRANGIRGGKAEIEGSKSSQYVSSLLLAGPYAHSDIEIQIKGDAVSSPYIDLTLEVMRSFGAAIHREDDGYFQVASGQGYQPGPFEIEGDVSSASYFWAASAVTEGTVTTENIHPYATRQGDIGLLGILEEMGCQVVSESDRVVVQGGALSGIEVDMGAMPDMVPTLAAVSLFAEGKTTIRNVSHLRYKESDRLKAISLEWHRIGAHIEELKDGLIIYGDGRLSGKVVNPHDDHRIAMALAVVGLRVPGIRIRNEQCVNKSFPRFWELWDRL